MTWRNWVLAVFGAWFVVSAWLLGVAHIQAYLWSAIILGGLTLLGSLSPLVLHGRQGGPKWLAYVVSLFGLYLGLNPWFYGFSSNAGALWVTMLVGAAILAAGLMEAMNSKGSPSSSPERSFKRSA